MKTATREKPILFSAPMVRALLREAEKPGTGKSQTRRLVKHGHVFRYCPGGDFSREERRAHYASPFRWDQKNPVHPTMAELLTCCPFGNVGDRLWVREKCYIEPGITAENWNRASEDEVVYAADRADGQVSWAGEGGVRWRPSIHMPRWASRLSITIIERRAQRVQDISGDDAMAELGHARDGTYPAEFGYHNRLFAELWDSINGPGAWKRNDLVWALTYTVEAHA